MTRVEKAVKNINNELVNRNILEVACGCGEFSICASKIAKTVHCIDLGSERLLPEAVNCSNLYFSEMDATAMSYGNNSFDTVIIYNAIGHLEQVMEKVVDECLRVLRANGSVYIISSFMMDKQVITDRLLPLLEQKNITCIPAKDNIFFYIQIRK